MHNETSVPEPSSSGVETGTENLKRYVSPGTYQILAELIQRGNTLVPKIHKLINYIWNKGSQDSSVSTETRLQAG